jgi:hypothetical protein
VWYLLNSSLTDAEEHRLFTTFAYTLSSLFVVSMSTISISHNLASNSAIYLLWKYLRRSSNLPAVSLHDAIAPTFPSSNRDPYSAAACTYAI